MKSAAAVATTASLLDRARWNLVDMQREALSDGDRSAAGEVFGDALESLEASPYERHQLYCQVLKMDGRERLASHWRERERADVARLWLDELPQPAALRRRKNIKSMSNAERAGMQPHAQKWIDFGLSITRADRPLFEAGAHAIYRRLGWNAPKIVWSTSPIAVVLAAPIAAYLVTNGLRKGNDSVGASVDASVDASVRASVDASVGASVRASVGASVDDSVGDSVRASVDASVGDSVGASVGASVGDSVRDSVDDSVGDSKNQRASRANAQSELTTAFIAVQKRLYHQYLGGQFWVGGYYWYGDPASASFFVDEMGLELQKSDLAPGELETRARAYWATAMAACWWWPGKDFIIVSERPTKLEKYDDGRLKCVEWPDGWGVRK